MLNKLIIPFSILFLTIVLSFNFLLKGEHLSLLANSFIQGKAYFLEYPGNSWIDTTPFGEKYFWPAGPFPIILLLPFVAIFRHFGLFFYQGYLQPVLVFVIFILCFKMARKVGYNRNDSLFLSFAFCFSTVFINVALWPYAWGFTQVVSVFVLFLIIYGYFKNFSWWSMGLLAGLAAASRLPTLGIFVFYILSIFFDEKREVGKRFKNALMATIPFLIIIFLVGYYNYIRFGDFFDQGYQDQILTNQNLEKAREYGLTNPIHIPGNLYYFLMSTPLPVFRDDTSHVLKFPFIRANPWGMSIFVTSPIFFYLFFLSYKDKLSKILILTVVAIAVPIFLYYGVGWRQAGYRYSLDFLPLLFWLLIKNYKIKFKKLSSGFKALILISAYANLHFVLTAFLYP